MAITMFLKEMGFEEGADFQGWVHVFRQNEFYDLCGRPNSCLFFDPSWYKFKVVRNPYERVVSSYLHTMTQTSDLPDDRFLLKSIPGIHEKRNISFNNFLTYIEHNSPSPLAQDLHSGNHIEMQAYAFEFYAWQNGKTVYNQIVKLEELAAGIARVNSEAGTHYPANVSSHHFERKESVTSYVGDLPWNQLKGKIPDSYGHFYNAPTKERVARIFFADLLVYNYSFPY